ncbi:hypothetical protein TcWFU_002796 [Taenia crassiceps]|uniref:Uncharacterized protein n=1 Tax=Taenia crassiceps TaxID=6207 RepID=A0ABR4QJK8_9CEST
MCVSAHARLHTERTNERATDRPTTTRSYVRIRLARAYASKSVNRSIGPLARRLPPPAPTLAHAFSSCNSVEVGSSVPVLRTALNLPTKLACSPSVYDHRSLWHPSAFSLPLEGASRPLHASSSTASCAAFCASSACSVAHAPVLTFELEARAANADRQGVYLCVVYVVYRRRSLD